MKAKRSVFFEQQSLACIAKTKIVLTCPEIAFEVKIMTMVSPTTYSGDWTKNTHNLFIVFEAQEMLTSFNFNQETYHFLRIFEDCRFTSKSFEFIFLFVFKLSSLTALWYEIQPRTCSKYFVLFFRLFLFSKNIFFLLKGKFLVSSSLQLSIRLFRISEKNSGNV